MNFPPQKNTLYKLDASFSEVHRNRLEFTGDSVKISDKPFQAPSFPSPSQDIRLVPASKTPPSPTPHLKGKAKGSVRFANDIKVDYFFYPSKSVDQPVRMRRAIYDDEEGILLYYLEICEEGLEEMWNIPHRTVRCQINGKKGMIERLNKEKQRQEELELAGYGHSGGVEAEDKDLGGTVPVNHKMKNRLARLREETKEEQLLDPDELEIARKTAENTRMNAGAVNISRELREPRMGHKRRHHISSLIIPLPLDTPENTSDSNPRDYRKGKSRAAQSSGGNPGDPLRMPTDDIPKTNTESDIVHQKRIPKSAKSGIGTEKPLQWDDYLKITRKESTVAHEDSKALGSSCLDLLRPFSLVKKSKKHTSRNPKQTGKKREDTS